MKILLNSDNKLKIEIKSEKEAIELGFKLGLKAPNKSLIILSGPLGSGKTVITKGIAKALEIKEPIVSPSFTLFQEYSGTKELRHLDLYRIDSIEEFDSLGGEELFYLDGLTVIEWGEKIDELPYSKRIRVTIEVDQSNNRQIEIEGLTL